MEQHEAQEVERKQAAEAAMSQDGWTVVVRGKARVLLQRGLPHVGAVAD